VLEVDGESLGQARSENTTAILERFSTLSKALVLSVKHHRELGAAPEMMVYSCVPREEREEQKLDTEQKGVSFFP
jgi:hypothetical protein